MKQMDIGDLTLFCPSLFVGWRVKVWGKRTCAIHSWSVVAAERGTVSPSTIVWHFHWYIYVIEFYLLCKMARWVMLSLNIFTIFDFMVYYCFNTFDPWFSHLSYSWPFNFMYCKRYDVLYWHLGGVRCPTFTNMLSKKFYLPTYKLN